MNHEDFVEQVKSCGRSIIDNAEKIYNSFEYSTAGVQIMIEISARAVPEITVIKKFLPEDYINCINTTKEV